MTHSTGLKSLLTLAILTIVSIQSIAQDSVSNWVLSDQLELMLNETKVTSETTLEEIEAIIGKASSSKEFPNNEVSYQYESLGLIISTMNDQVKLVGFNFNWDGDEKFPETSYTGSLQIGNYNFTKKTSDKDVAKIEGIEYACPIPSICATKDRKAKIKSMIAFEESIITQVLIMLE